MESDEILIAYPVRKRNQQLGDDKAPIVWLSIPFRRYILHCKDQDLEQRVIGGEHRPCLGDLPQLVEDHRFHPRDVPCRHALRIHGDDLALYVRYIPLVLLVKFGGLQQRLECTVPVPRNIDVHVSKRCSDPLAAMAVATVGSAFSSLLVLFIAEMVIEFALQHLLKHRREHILDVFDALGIKLINEL